MTKTKSHLGLSKGLVKVMMLSSVCMLVSVKSVLSHSLEGFLINETAVRLCCLYHLICDILISHAVRFVHLDEYIHGQNFCCKC